MLQRFQFDEAFLEMSIVTEILIVKFLLFDKVTDKKLLLLIFEHGVY